MLIDQTCHARLADFGLLTIISDPANLLFSSSCTQGGTARWMSPELIAPQRFGLKNSRPTKSSDCYALGMVIYETVSGNLPFHEDSDLTVFVKVLDGGCPRRGARFTQDLWKVLKQCWASPSNNRPSAEDILQSLERLPNLSEPPPGADERMEDDVSECTIDSSFSIPSDQGSDPPITLSDQENRSRSLSSSPIPPSLPPSPLLPPVQGSDSAHYRGASPYGIPPGNIGEPSRQPNFEGNLSDVGPPSSGGLVHETNQAESTFYFPPSAYRPLDSRYNYASSSAYSPPSLHYPVSSRPSYAVHSRTDSSGSSADYRSQQAHGDAFSDPANHSPGPSTGSTGVVDSNVQVQSISTRALSNDQNPSSPSNPSKTYAFVSLLGTTIRERPRRRYDEIESLYHCSWPDCTKSYGTLNHLNAHVVMQKHGARRLPSGEHRLDLRSYLCP